MLRTGTLETKRAKLMVAVVALVLLAVFQVALQAKPANAWEMRVTITGAGTVEETTPAELLNCSTSSTNPTGEPGATCLAGTPSGAYGNLWDVDYLATPASGYTFKQWESDGTTRSPIICDRSTPAATTATYSGSTACKFRATGNLQTRVVFEDKNAPSQPSVSGPTSPVNQSATFFFPSTSDPTFKQFECRIQSFGSSFQACRSGDSWSVTNLTDGNHTFQVQARDHSNNVSSIGSTVFTVDRTAPTTTISSGPTDDSTSRERNVSFAYSSSESGSFECNLTGPGFPSTTFGSCPPFFLSNSGTINYTNLKDGTYTFKVRARDQAGNVDATPVDRTWRINNVPTVDPASLTPTKGATNVLRDANVGATFSEEMAAVSLKNADNTSSTFKLQQYNKKTRKYTTIPATIALSLSGGKTTATLDPYGATEGTTMEKPLAGNKKFRATITTGAKDLDSNPLATKVMWTFNTGSLTG